MLITFSIFVFVYHVLLLCFWYGWRRLSKFEYSFGKVSWQAIDPVENKNNRLITASVIVPMRDEETNIASLINELVAQKYPASEFRIMIVDDHSTDASISIVKQYRHIQNIDLIHLPKDKHGKKAALGYALPLLNSELIITLDADCSVSSDWLPTIIAYYVKHKPAMIICPVIFSYGRSFFSRWQALEMMSLTGSSAGAVGIGHPVMCSGANLAMERSTMMRYASVYNSSIVSGDDMMMMINIKRDNLQCIHYLKSVAATVETTPQPNLKSFLRQRNRWTSKSSSYGDAWIIMVALIVFFANLSVVACLCIGFFFQPYLWLAIILWVMMILSNWIFLRDVTQFWSKAELMRIFLPAQILHPFYITSVGILGNLLPVKWKGRVS